jgi:flagellar biosynthesis chaperone FliJ
MKHVHQELPKQQPKALALNQNQTLDSSITSSRGELEENKHNTTSLSLEDHEKHILKACHGRRKIWEGLMEKKRKEAWERREKEEGKVLQLRERKRWG